MHKKGSHFIKRNTRCLEVFSFPENRSVWGHLSKWIFAEGRSTRSPWCLEEIQGPIWRSKDHLVIKGLSNNVKNHEFKRFHYSVRQKIGDAGSVSTQNMFPLRSVVSKPPESPYGANPIFVGQKSSFSAFWSCRTPVGP